MARTVRPATTPALGSYALANQEYIDPGRAIILCMSRDRSRFYACDANGGNQTTGNTLYYSTDLDTAAAPTWTLIKNFNAAGGNSTYGITGCQELYNGEMLVSVVDGGGHGRLWRSTGFAANPATATWTLVYSCVSGNTQWQYSWHPSCFGSNGVILLADSAAGQTGGNNTTDVTNHLGGVLVLSTDHGATWTQVFDLRDYGISQGFSTPAGVHMHGCAYDEVWDRLWLCYGDNTGQGDDIAGVGYHQVVFSDDRGATWQKLPASTRWGLPSGGGDQFVFVTPMDDFVMFSPDVGIPNMYCLPRKAGKTFGEVFVSPNMAGNGGGQSGQVGGTVQRPPLGKVYPTLFSPNFATTLTGDTTIPLIVLSADQRSMSVIPMLIPVETTNNTGAGFSAVWGPTVAGKYVARCRHHVGGVAKTLFRFNLIPPG